MVHRAIFGSIERFFGILIESTNGDFPFWMAPGQWRLLPVTEEAVAFCKEVVVQAKAYGLRAEVDTTRNTLGKMIRTAEQEKVCVMAVVGAKEMETSSLALRARGNKDLGQFGIEQSLTLLAEAVKASIEPIEAVPSQPES